MLYFFILIGLIMGSFYTVVGLRLPKNESIITPGSHCESCNHFLKWYELIPILSYIIQGGKCRKCKKKLSIVYPGIELLSGILFGLSFYLYGISYELIISLSIVSLLIIIFVSDFTYLVILDSPLIVFSIVTILTKFLYVGMDSGIRAIVNGLVLFGFMYLIKIIGDKVFKRESLGGGDIKLSFFIGAVLNIKLSFVALVIGSFLALPVASYYVFKRKEKEIPFGPFLISGTLIAFIFSAEITEFINLLFLIN